MSSFRPVVVPSLPIRAGQKRPPSEPAGDVERQGREYYLRPALDSLEAAFPPRRWGELQGAPFERNLAHLESSASAVCSEFATFIIGFNSTSISDRSPFQVLGYASLSCAKFSGMQQAYNMLKEERDEVMRAANRYREELHQRKEELKGAFELLASCQQSLLATEKEQEYASRELERARAHLEGAKAIIQGKDGALQVAAREQDALKAEMTAKVTKAEVDAVQAYKDSFKDTMDYLFLQ